MEIEKNADKKEWFRKRKKRRQERVGSVDADLDNQENRKEADRKAHH